MSSEGATDSGANANGPYFNLRVTEVIDETADSRSIVMDVPAELEERFRYASGQFLSFRVEVAGQRIVRCYSLASAPGIDAARALQWRIRNHALHLDS